MNNEIGRKITSLTLMTIMLAGGMFAVVPAMVPAAHAANANLFVSAENSQFNNYVSGPQVTEVVVIDSNISDTDQGKGEPDVKVNGKKLRMVQNVDGNWYGYFADKTMATTADATTTVAGQGLDFGKICTAAQASVGTGLNFTDTSGVALNTADCTSSFVANSPTEINVVREAKQINQAVVTGTGTNPNGVNPAAWPFIQLYSLSQGGNVVVSYNKGGGVQSTTLTFDSVDQFAKADLDKVQYTQKSQVHATITDRWLNIDPTDEDSWTFGTNSTNGLSTNYQVFNENGGAAGSGVVGGIINIQPAMPSMMIENNGILILNVDKQNSGTPVLTIQDNDDSITVCTNDQLASTCSVGPAAGLGLNSQPVTITEQGPNSGIFGTYDESDVSALKITDNAKRGTSATIDYNEVPKTILVGFDFATIKFAPSDAEWNSGESIPVTLVDGDANKNSRADEDLDLFNPDVTLIPALQTGDPFTLGEKGTESLTAAKAVWIDSPATVTTAAGKLASLSAQNNATATITVQKFSERAIVKATGASTVDSLVVDLRTTIDDLRQTIRNPTNTTTGFHGFNFLNLDVRSLSTTGTFDVYLLNSTSNIINATGFVADGVGALKIASGVSPQGLTMLNATTTNAQIFNTANTPSSNDVGLLFVSSALVSAPAAQATDAIAADFFSYGFLNDGVKHDNRIANQIIRLELEETGDNTSTFAGTLEYIMLNQLNILDPTTYTGLSTIANDPTFIVIEDLDNQNSPRINYNDLGADGVTTQVSYQQAAAAHSGIVSFDQENYKVADTVTVTVQDVDLNVDSDLIDIYTVVTDPGRLQDVVGKNSTSIRLSTGDDLGRLLDIQFNDANWITPAVGSACDLSLDAAGVTDKSLSSTGFTLIETAASSGKFTGTFQIPSAWCAPGATTASTVTGLNLGVDYVDFRDASGEIIEVGDSAGVRANTGSVSLDRTVYPVPFGIPSDFAASTLTTPSGRSIFPIHQTGMSHNPQPAGLTAGLDSGEFLANGDLTIHVRVNDADFDTSASGEDKIGQNTTGTNVGPVKISVLRGSSSMILGYAGGDAQLPGKIHVGKNDVTSAPQFGPMVEVAPDAGIFESDITVRYTDGPASSICPATTDFAPLNGAVDVAANPVTDRFDTIPVSGNYCILQGDILQVEYTDPADASGNVNTVTDSATFDLRNGVLQSDKSVYIIGSDMILTLIEPDFDLDNERAETYSLDLIEWDSDAATVTMGAQGGNQANFDPEPLNFRETGDNTGIFQIVVEIPKTLNNDNLERGEEIKLEYSDWGPSGSDFVGDEDQDVKLTVFTSNFGATVALDQKVYTWTDKVYITIVAPDHNFDSNLIDDIGNTPDDPIKVSTRSAKLSNYRLVETGTDTGIFTGEVILTGFTHDADGDPTSGDANGNDVISTPASGSGPTSGKLPATDNDGLTVSFEFSKDETVVGSALIRWNIGEVQWLEASYPAKGTGVVRIIDPDMNLNPESVDNFNANVWSDSDAGGIDLTVTETNEATGIFEGTVFFTVTDESSGHRLRVAEGDTVTAEYEDNTLPSPYTTADELRITATTLIGTIVPPLERAPAANLRIVDAFGNSLSTVNVDQQVQITADLANGQDKKQVFAYLVQIQDGNGVTVSLAWITGALSAGQSFSPALSWIPTQAGTYTATAFVWESVDNPTALSPPVSVKIIVQ